MKRILVAGGLGFFGGAIVNTLRAEGLAPLIASRRNSADVVLDVEDAASIAAVVRPGDIMVDAVGPFQRRTTQLVRSACEIGFDVVDLADHLAYVRDVYALAPRIEQAAVRVFTACSSVSSVSAAMITRSGVKQPTCVTGFLVPATRHTAVAGTAASLFCSVGRPVEVLRDGRLATCRGWCDRRWFAFPTPLGRRTGYRFESADAFTLPKVWPSLQQVDFFVDTNVFTLNTVLALAARTPPLRAIIGASLPLGLKLSRLLGRDVSGLAYEIEDAAGGRVRMSLTSRRNGYLIAIAPALLAVRRRVAGAESAAGLISPDRHVDVEELFAWLAERGIELTTTTADAVG
ncbi:MAG: hypothetical protein RIC55_31895 [Pirellulaceae bacterium]